MLRHDPEAWHPEADLGALCAQHKCWAGVNALVELCARMLLRSW
jgi:hypothetical protein